MADRSSSKSELNSPDSPQSTKYSTMGTSQAVDPSRCRYPYCIVWTPIPCLSWFFPFIGHMGIALSNGIIRDFSGSYFVAEDNMGFGKPTRYWQLKSELAAGGQQGWDRGVLDASEEYKNRMHNLILDNCHCHVAMALNNMNYNGSKWNMVKLSLLMLIKGKFVSFFGFLKTWMPFLIIVSSFIILSIFVHSSS